MSLLNKFKQIILGDTATKKEGQKPAEAHKKPASKIKISEVDKKQQSHHSSAKEDKRSSKPVAKRDDSKKEERKPYRNETRVHTHSRPYVKKDETLTGDKPKEDRFKKTYNSSSTAERSDRPDRPERPERPERPSSSRYSSSDRFAKKDGRYPSRNNSSRGGRRGTVRGRFNDDNVAGVNLEHETAMAMGNWTIDDFSVEVADGKTRFHDFDIPARIMRGIQVAGYEYCTPIQALILPEAFKGTDVSGKAQTGTGKTAAFLITIFKKLLEVEVDADRATGTPRVLIMAPTRELVIQIEKDARSIGKYCGFYIQSVFGGINYDKQKKQVEGRKIDILVATPGRLLDYKEQNILHLDKVEILVIDEADRMLDMGFIPDMKEIIGATPAKGTRQTMLFSATLTPEILRLASQWTKNPLSFEAKSKELTAEQIEQRAYIVENKEKFPVMCNMILKENLTRIIVFGNRRDEVAKLADMFKLADISCGILSGDISQAKRIRTLEDLRQGKIRVLCATDVAARGIHVDDVSHVFNFTLPDDPEDYVHRIGRTGRAGAKGISVIFATEEDSYYIPRIEKFTGHKLVYINPTEEETTLSEDLKKIIPIYKSYSARQRGTPQRSSGGGRSAGGNRSSAGGYNRDRSSSASRSSGGRSSGYRKG